MISTGYKKFNATIGGSGNGGFKIVIGVFVVLLVVIALMLIRAARNDRRDALLEEERRNRISNDDIGYGYLI